MKNRIVSKEYNNKNQTELIKLDENFTFENLREVVEKITNTYNLKIEREKTKQTELELENNKLLLKSKFKHKNIIQ